MAKTRIRHAKIQTPAPAPHDNIGASVKLPEPSPAEALHVLRSAPPGAVRSADLLALQRTIGNQAVQAILKDIADRQRSSVTDNGVARQSGARQEGATRGGAVPGQGNRPIVPAVQRLTFERTNSGALGSLLWRADYDADTWLANFKELKEILSEVSVPLAKLTDEGLKNSFAELQDVVDAYEDAKVVAAKRAEVGGLINESLGEAKTLREKVIEANKRRIAEEERVAEEQRKAEEARKAEELRKEQREEQFALAGAGKQAATLVGDMRGLKEVKAVTSDPRVTKEKEEKRLAEEVEKKRLAEEAEKQRLAEEAEKKRLAEEAEKKRLAEEAEKKRLAEEAEKKRLVEHEAAPVLASLESAVRLGYTKTPAVSEMGSQYKGFLAAKEWEAASANVRLLRSELSVVSGYVGEIDSKIKAAAEAQKLLKQGVTKTRITEQLEKHARLSWVDKVKGLSPTEDVDGGVSSLEFDLSRAKALDGELSSIVRRFNKLKSNTILEKYFNVQAGLLRTLSWDDQANSMTDPAIPAGVAMFKADLDVAEDMKPRFGAVESGIKELTDKRAGAYLEAKIEAHGKRTWKEQVADLPELETGLATAKDVAKRLDGLDIGIKELTDNPTGRKNLETWLAYNEKISWEKQLEGLTKPSFYESILNMEERLLKYNARFAERLKEEKEKVERDRLAKLAAAAEKKRLVEEAAETAASRGGNGVAIPTVTVASLTGTARLIDLATDVEEDKTEGDAVQAVLDCIAADTKPKLTHPNGQKWGRPANAYSNFGGRLPGTSGAGGYKEWYVEKNPTDGDYHGSRRLLTRNGASYVYYTSDHYATFKRIR